MIPLHIAGLLEAASIAYHVGAERGCYAGCWKWTRSCAGSAGWGCRWYRWWPSRVVDRIRRHVTLGGSHDRLAERAPLGPEAVSPDWPPSRVGSRRRGRWVARART